MITNEHDRAATGQSATIIPFPVGGRRGVPGKRDVSGAADLMAQRISDAVSMCWYHDEAIRDSAAPANS
jgi:hypothetical protein